VDKNTDERDLMDYLTFPQALIANPFNPANPLFFTSFINTVFPGEPDLQSLPRVLDKTRSQHHYQGSERHPASRLWKSTSRTMALEEVFGY
jgi:hypothetical protein